MLAFILSILTSTLIFIIFKGFNKYKIDSFQAIVFNYFTAFCCGTFIINKDNPLLAFDNVSWLPYCIVCGSLFISLFYLMSQSTVLNGMGTTSIAVKMSMALSLLFIFIYQKESFQLLKILAFAFAFLSVLFVSRKKDTASNKAGWMLIVLFLGSGILDVILNLSTQSNLVSLSSSLFSAFSFGFAGILGFAILVVLILSKRKKFHWKNLVAGICLGIPNYFSIYFFLEAYNQLSWSDTSVLALTNLGIVILSSIIGILFFKDVMNRFKWIGFGLCGLSILLLILN